MSNSLKTNKADLRPLKQHKKFQTENRTNMGRPDIVNESKHQQLPTADQDNRTFLYTTEDIFNRQSPGYALSDEKRADFGHMIMSLKEAFSALPRDIRNRIPPENTLPDEKSVGGRQLEGSDSERSTGFKKKDKPAIDEESVIKATKHARSFKRLFEQVPTDVLQWWPELCALEVSALRGKDILHHNPHLLDSGVLSQDILIIFRELREIHLESSARSVDILCELELEEAEATSL
jgi:hypothetical protein